MLRRKDERVKCDHVEGRRDFASMIGSFEVGKMQGSNATPNACFTKLPGYQICLVDDFGGRPSRRRFILLYIFLFFLAPLLWCAVVVALLFFFVCGLCFLLFC